MFDIIKRFRSKPTIKTAHETTMDIQKTELNEKAIRTPRKSKSIKRPEIKIIFTQMGDIKEFEDLIENYYELGFKLLGNVSIAGFTACATLIKQ